MDGYPALVGQTIVVGATKVLISLLLPLLKEALEKKNNP